MNSLHLRKASISDMSFFYELKNDSTALQFSVTGKKVSKLEHEAWFINQIDNQDRVLIVGKDSSNNLIGYARYDREDNYFISSINIKRDFRSQGYGKELLLRSEGFLPKEFSLMAIISKKNDRSIKLFESCLYAYDSEYKDPDFLVYKKGQRDEIFK